MQTDRQLQDLTAHLRRARATILTAQLLRGLLLWGGGALALWGGLAAADSLLALPMEFRLPLMVVATAVTVLTGARALLRPVMAFHDLDRTALALESRFGIPRNLLINAFQLSRRQLSGEEAILARQTIRQGLGRCVGVTPRALWQAPSLVKAAGLALAVGAVWLAAGMLFPAHLRLSLNRLCFPLADVPPAGRVILTVEPDRDVTVLEGDSHQILLRVAARGRRQRAGTDGLAPPRIVMADTHHVGVAEGAGERGRDMLPAGTGTPATGADALYTHTVTDLRHSQAFRIYHDAGGTYTRSYRVRVQRAPEMIESEFRLTPPAYTGLDTSHLPGPPRPVTGLPASALTIALRLDHPVDNLFWEAGDQRLAFDGQDDGMRWEATTVIREAGTYAVYTLLDDDARRLPIASGSLLVDRDQPPHVAFTTDRLNREAWPGETVDFEIRATDDYGIATVTLSMTPAHAFEETGRELATWTLAGPPGDPRPAPLRIAHTLNPADFTPGDDYLFQARATDFHPDRQTGTSRPLLIRIRGMTDAPEATPVSSALEALQQAIVWQRRALSDTRTVADYMASVLGRDPDRPDFTFHHHREPMETRQARVYDLLGLVTERAADPALPPVREVAAVRAQSVQPLLEEIRNLAGDPTPWFAADTPTAACDDGAIRFAPHKSRYIGLAWPGSPDPGLAAIDLLDADGQAIPPPYVDRYQFSPRYHPWDGPVGFVDADAADLRRITAAALETPLQDGRGPLMTWEGRVEGAPARGVALYGVRVIRTDSARQVAMWTGSSDSLRVWLNGERVVNRLARRAPSPDQERTVLELAPGTHHLLMEVSVADRAPVIALRFSETDGTPLALHADGRLAKAVQPKVVYAGGAPAQAVQALDRNRRTAWHVPGDRPRLFIADLGHAVHLSGLTLHAPEAHAPASVGPCRVYLAGTLRIDATLPPAIDAIAARQSAILDRLAAIRAGWLDAVDTVVQPEAPETDAADAATLPPVAVAGDWLELVAELLDTGGESIGLAEQRRSVLDLFGDDFSEEALARLQAIKDQEKRLAAYLRDIVQDMSALGDLDLSDATQVANRQEFVERAERLAALAAEKADAPIAHITDSLDTAELELHEELRKQSEVAFGDTSRLQDVQELGEDMKVPLPMAELPRTLSDLVGEMEEGLLEFDDEAQSVGSMLKSLDADGPIGPGRMSSTSAEGKTGDEPPDAARELEGRSGFGRTGRASGEGVTDVAEDLPQDSGAAPPRDTGTSLEAGMVEDRSTEAVAESTGLGKETDDTEAFGMGGSALPPGILDRMRETARRQDELRETLDRMTLELQRHHLPTVKLSRAARTLDTLAGAAEAGDLPGFLHAYRDSLEHLYAAEADIGHQVGVRYVLERRRATGGDARAAALTDVPEAYRDIVSQYFKALADEDE